MLGGYLQLALLAARASLCTLSLCFIACLAAALTLDHCAAQASARQAAEASSERHSGAVLGGFKEVDASSPEVQHVVQYAVGELAQQSNSLSPPKLEEVRLLLLEGCKATKTKRHWVS